MSKTEDRVPLKPPHLTIGPDDPGDDATQPVASGAEGRKVNLQAPVLLLQGVQLPDEVQHLLLQGVESLQADPAFFLPQPLLFDLLQALLL